MYRGVDCIGPTDGRYNLVLEKLRSIAFTERQLILTKADVEISWLEWLVITLDGSKASYQDTGIQIEDSKAVLCALESVRLSTRLPEFVDRVLDIEAQTRHDTKSVELVIRELLLRHTVLCGISELTHLGLTSEDITGTSYALMYWRAYEKCVRPLATDLVEALVDLAHNTADMPLLSLTHGQAASPTTFGKEVSVFLQRLHMIDFAKPFAQYNSAYIKFGGAVGTHAAAMAAFRDIDWINVITAFIAKLTDDVFKLDICTTQVPNREWLFEHLRRIEHANAIFMDLAEDFWLYISRGVLGLRIVRGEVGSSTMPHKVNPIQFENAEGNLEVANSMISTLCKKLAVSRLQRDLSDSTVIRNLGVAVGHTIVAWTSLLQGIRRSNFNEKFAVEELRQNPQLLAEPFQSVLRKYPQHFNDPYDQLKHLVRDTTDKDVLKKFLESQCKGRISATDYNFLSSLSCESYLGCSASIARKVIKIWRDKLKSS